MIYESNYIANLIFVSFFAVVLTSIAVRIDDYR